MGERRRRPRWRTSFFFKTDKEYRKKYFDVVDRKTQQSIGHLVDLTPEGLGIISREHVKRGQIFVLRIDLPEQVNRVDHIQATVRCLWCEQDVNPEFYNVGFEVLSITPPYAEIIDILIQE